MTKTLFSSGRMLTVFVTVITIAKVMLDRYVAMPLVEKRGRGLFEQTTETIKAEIVSIVAAIFVLEWGAQQETQPKDLIQQVSLRIAALKQTQSRKN